MEILGTVLMHKKKILYTFSALFLIIVLAFTAMYQVANYMQNNISNIEKFIYEKTQITTKIGRAHLDWFTFNPKVELDDVSFQRSAQDEISSKKVFLDLSSLLQTYLFSTDQSTRLSVSMEDMVLKSKSNFSNSLSFDYADIGINLQNNTSQIIFNLENTEIVVGDGQLTLNDNNPEFFDLSFTIESLDLKHMTNYLPKDIRASDKAWLRKSFKDGAATGSVHAISEGGEIPFGQGNTKFEGYLDAENITLDYLSDHPELQNFDAKFVFLNNSLAIKGSKISTMGLNVSNFVVNIKDLRSVEVSLSGNVKGELSDVIQYLTITSLIDSSVASKATAKGLVDVSFQFDIPVDENIKAESQFSGSAVFDKAMLKIQPVKSFEPIFLSDISGILDFSSEGLTSKKITAKFHDKSLIFNIKTIEDSGVQVSTSLKSPMSLLLPKQLHKSVDFITGEAKWDISILTSSFTNTEKKDNMQIRLASDMRGITVDALKPFAKKKNETVSSIFNVMFLDTDKLSINIKYGDIFSTDFKFDQNILLEGGEIAFKSDYISGTGIIPSSNDELPVVLNLDYLHLQDDIDTDTSFLLDPKTISPLVLKIKQFSLGEMLFENIHANTKPTDTGMEINIEQIESKKLKGVMHLLWDVTENEAKTILKVDFDSENLEETLDNWNIKNTLRRGVAKFKGQFSWTGAPYNFSSQAFIGDASLDVKDGRIRDAGPEVARLLALFNISLIAKRLSLDFDDVTKNGFTFDTMRGNLHFEDGNIYTGDLLTVGPSAQVLVVGRIGLTDKDYDLQVLATPELSESLPVAAAVGGPIAAAAVFVAEKVLKQLGHDIDKLIQVRYTVKGPWDAPITETIKQ